MGMNGRHVARSDTERNLVWGMSEAAGLLNPRCFVDAGEACWGKPIGFSQDPELVHRHCVGCRGLSWLTDQRSRRGVG